MRNIYVGVPLTRASAAILESICPKALGRCHAERELLLLPLDSIRCVFVGGESLSSSDLNRLLSSAGGSLMVLEL